MGNPVGRTEQESLVGQASASVQDAASTAQKKTVELKDQGKSRLGETLDQRTNDAAAQARQLAQALRRSGEQLSEEGSGRQAAGLAEGAANRVERVAGYLEQTSGAELVRDMEDFARRRPWMVAGAGLVAGLAASRFLKASSERRYAGSAQAGAGSPSSHGYGMSSPESLGRPADEPIARERYGTSR
jgi:hypothetical protein